MATLVKDLLDAYEVLAAANSALSIAIRNQSDMPRFLPTFSGEEAGEVDAVVRSLTEIWHLEDGDELLGAGLICGNNEVVQAVDSLNEAKVAFKKAVDAIRGDDKTNSTLFSLADQQLGHDGRGDELREAMRTARIGRLDLLKCYKLIRVMPSSLESLSWTWARTHTKSEPITMEGAEKMAHQRLSGSNRDAVLGILGNLAPGTQMTRLYKLPNQLRANIVWKEDGERKRKPLSISGIVVMPGDKLPKLVWRDDPGPRTDDEAALTRADSKIDREPYIRALGIHLYLEQES
jgi:hypothetical protein